MDPFTIVAGIIALGGTVASGYFQAKALERANKMAHEDWREELRLNEEQRKKDNLRNTLKTFEDTINRSEIYKKNVGALWSGRG